MGLQARWRRGIVGTRNDKNVKTVAVFSMVSHPTQGGICPRIPVSKQVCQLAPASPSIIKMPGSRKVPIRVDRTYLWVAPVPAEWGLFACVSDLTQPSSVPPKPFSETNPPPNKPPLTHSLYRTSHGRSKTSKRQKRVAGAGRGSDPTDNLQHLS